MKSLVLGVLVSIFISTGCLFPIESLAVHISIDGIRVKSIVGHPELDLTLDSGEYLGQGEMGVVYGLGKTQKVLKIEKADGQIRFEAESSACLSKNLSAFHSIVASIPIELTEVILEDGTQSNAVIKPLIDGFALDKLNSSQPEAQTIKKAMSTFLEELILSSAEKPFEFFLNDFKLSNLMWGKLPGEKDNHLILIDVNCFEKSSFSNEFTAPQNERLKMWSEHYFLQILGKTTQYNWKKKMGAFEFVHPELKVYYQELLERQKKNEEVESAQLEAKKPIIFPGNPSIHNPPSWKAWHQRHPELATGLGIYQ